MIVVFHDAIIMDKTMSFCCSFGGVMLVLAIGKFSSMTNEIREAMIKTNLVLHSVKISSDEVI